MRLRDYRFVASFVVIGLAGASFVIAACLSPTQINLEIYSDIDCNAPGAAWKGITVYAGPPGPDLETRNAAYSMKGCEGPGLLGTIAITPTGSKNDEVALRVVAGLTTNPEQCQGAGYQGCIVARRQLRFIPHQNDPVKVWLTSSCENIACNATTTCDVTSGRCADNSVVGNVVLDSGILPVRCGESGLRCGTSGDVCCLTLPADAQGPVVGVCEPAVQCLRPGVVLNCDDEIDCAGQVDADGGAYVCDVSYSVEGGDAEPAAVSSSQCLPRGGAEVVGSTRELCENVSPCRGGIACNETNTPVLPRYHWCRYDPKH